MAREPCILIAGALGVVGRAALEEFERHEGTIIGLSRRRPDFETPADWLALDLTDEAACRTALAPLVGRVTHIVYCALYEERELVRGWMARDQIDVNLAMLRNLVEPLTAAGSVLKHVTLLQGTKAYGVHHGSYKMPARESDPRFIAPNFYYDQEDYLRARASGAGWSFTVLRPQIVCGFALSNPMNAATAIGVYAAICRELGQPMRFSGGVQCYQEAVDAGLLARAIRWAGQEPRCRGETYNIANGDCFSWVDLWPRFARRFGIEPGVAHSFSMAQIMPQHGKVWDRLVARHGLRPYAYEEIVSSWQFLDYVLRYGRTQPHHSMVSTIKARQHGFSDCMDTEVMFDAIFDRLQEEKVLPGSE